MVAYPPTNGRYRFGWLLTGVSLKRPVGPYRNQVPRNIPAEEMLNFLYAQGGANSAGFGHHRVSLSLAPKPQEDEGGNHACSVKSSVPPARVQAFGQGFLQTVGAGKAGGENHAPEGQFGIARTQPDSMLHGFDTSFEFTKLNLGCTQRDVCLRVARIYLDGALQPLTAPRKLTDIG